MERKAFIVGAFEHPLRKAPNLSVGQLHAQAALGALADAGLSHGDVDGYCCAGDAPGLGPLSMVDYLNFKVRFFDTTDTGGSAYLILAARAAQAIEAGRCNVAVITMGGRPRSEAMVRVGGANPSQPDLAWETPYRMTAPASYAMAAKRHMYEFGTTMEQLAWVKVSASRHAQHNPHAMLPKPVTVAEVLASPLVADPLHRLDCCVVSDGGGAIVLAAEPIARRLGRPLVRIIGSGEAVKGTAGGDIDLTFSGGRQSGAAAFAAAGVSPADIKYASIYDSFTITVVIQLEDLGFCEKGRGGAFVADGNLISGTGRLPVNTDGGGLCNNHPGNRGGMIKILEAVRQLRGEAHPAVQVRNCNLALVHGTGGLLGGRHGSATLILERE
jgi:acetyl-CoA C-acetyltransferase